MNHHIFKCMLQYFFIFSFSIIFLCSCNNEEANDNALQLNDIVKSGIYYNMDNNRNDSISILENNQIQFINYNEKELLQGLNEILKAENIPEDEFLEGLKHAYTAEIHKGDIDNTYRIRVPVYGTESAVKLVVKYDADSKIMSLGTYDYKQKEMSESNDQSK